MTFEAKYDGKCGECGELIYKGDKLVMVDGAAVHAECASEVETAARPTCSECWEQIAVNGTCGCDDS